MNAHITVQIANHLKVSPNQIREIREWAKVYWVIVQGKRPTFVSKKVAKNMDNRIPATLEEARALSGIRFHEWDEECREAVQALLKSGKLNDYPLYPAHPMYEMVRKVAEKDCRLANVIPA